MNTLFESKQYEVANTSESDLSPANHINYQILDVNNKSKSLLSPIIPYKKARFFIELRPENDELNVEGQWVLLNKD